MVEVFKTSVLHKQDADKIIIHLLEKFPDCKFNFDLEDCDNIFRFVAEHDISCDVITVFKTYNFDINPL